MKKTLLIIPALLVLMLVWAAPAHSTGPNGEWHTWEVQGDYGPNWDKNYDDAFAQPQVYVGEGKLAPKCQTWYQQDNYRYPDQGNTIAEVIEDGLLHDGEDHHLTNWGGEGTAWKFVYNDDECPPKQEDEEPTPKPDDEGACGPAGSCGTVPDLTGEAVSAVGLCDGTEFVTTTTTEYWEEYDGVRTYVGSDTEVTREYDPTCKDDVAPPATPVDATATFTG